MILNKLDRIKNELFIDLPLKSPIESIPKIADSTYKELQIRYNKSLDLETFQRNYRIYKTIFSYSERWYVRSKHITTLISYNLLDEAFKEWHLSMEEQFKFETMNFPLSDTEIERLIQFETLFKRPLVNGLHLSWFASSFLKLTDFGLKNLTEIIKEADKELNNLNTPSFFYQFFLDYKFQTGLKLKGKKLDNYLELFNQDEIDFIEKKSKKNGKVLSKMVKKDGTLLQSSIFDIIRFKSCFLMRKAENNYREEIGLKHIGQGWISESELFYLIKKEFPQHRVVQHGRPEWLGRQHFDIWFPDLKIAIEYQGQQHDKPIDFFGGEIAFKKNIERDSLKRDKSIKEGIRLIEVRPGYNFEKLIKELKNFG